MATITTKFNVGDTVATIDVMTMRMKVFTIGRISATIGDRSKTDYYPVKDEGDVDGFASYPEERCFASEAELLRHISSKDM